MLLKTQGNTIANQVKQVYGCRERKMEMSCLVERKESGYKEKQCLVEGLEMRVMKHFTSALYSQEPNPIQLSRR